MMQASKRPLSIAKRFLHRQGDDAPSRRSVPDASSASVAPHLESNETDIPILQVRGLSKSFAGFPAVAGVNLDAFAGRAVGLMGPNGSGKTTLINVISGVYKPSGGTVTLRGHDVAGKPSHRLCRLGLNRTFQVPHPLGDLTVGDNVAIVRSRIHEDHVIFDGDPLEFVGLAGATNYLASTLTSSEQKLLDLARALAAGPDVLLIDELGAGLSARELEEVAGLLRQLKDAGLALIIVEHLMDFLEQIVDTVVVMEAGASIFRGTLRAAIADRRVIDIYLGE